MSFIKSSVTFQALAYKITKTPLPMQGQCPFFSPFTNPIVSISSLNYTLLRYFTRLHTKLFAIPWDTGVYDYNSSKGEKELVSFYSYKFKDYEGHYSSLTLLGQKRFKHLIPDLFVAGNGMCIFYNGCFVSTHKLYLNLVIHHSIISGTWPLSLCSKSLGYFRDGSVSEKKDIPRNPSGMADKAATI